MTKFFVYDNDVRRYRPNPNHPDDNVIDTTEIEETIGHLRKIDIGDAYLDGERSHIALRFRAIPNIEGYPRRDQEHYAYWIIDQEENDLAYENVPKGLKTLFESEGWEYAAQETDRKGSTDITDPKRIIKIWNQSLGLLTPGAEPPQHKTSIIESKASKLRSMSIPSGKFLNIGFSSFDEALELLIEMRDSSLTVVVGDLNKPEQVMSLDPDIIVEYDNNYDCFEKLNSFSKLQLSEVIKKEVINSIDTSLNRIREESDDWRTEIETINLILSCVQKQNRNQNPKEKTQNLSAEQFPSPARNIASDLQKFHKVYDFDKTQNNLKRTLIPSYIYDPQSPYDEVADKLETRLEAIETEIYDAKTADIIDSDEIKPSITYISELLSKDSHEVRNALYDNINEILEQNIYNAVKNDDSNLYQSVVTNPLYLGGIIAVLCVSCFALGIILASVYSVPYLGTLF